MSLLINSLKEKKSRLSGEPLSKRDNIIMDGNGLVLGRLASIVAKLLLNGNWVHVVNAEKIIITKSKKAAVAETEARLKVRTLASQSKNPKRPRRSENIVRRTVRGMLPWKKPRGKTAYKRLRVHVGVPGDLKKFEFQIPTDAKPINLKRSFITMKEYAKIMG